MFPSQVCVPPRGQREGGKTGLTVPTGGLRKVKGRQRNGGPRPHPPAPHSLSGQLTRRRTQVHLDCPRPAVCLSCVLLPFGGRWGQGQPPGGPAGAVTGGPTLRRSHDWLNALLSPSWNSSPLWNKRPSAFTLHQAPQIRGQPGQGPPFTCTHGDLEGCP